LDNIDVQRQLFLRVGALIGFASASQSRSDMSVALADWEAQKRAEKAARPAAAQDAKRQQSKITKEVIDRHAEAWRKRPEHSKQLRDGSIAAGICDEVNAELAAMGLHLKEGTIRKRLKKPDH
jgi:nucleosome binding factor SPN SPT16 subunit